MKFFLCVMGMVLIFEGLPYFAFPEKIRHILLQIQTLPDNTLRRLGFILMAAGMALTYIGKAG